MGTKEKIERLEGEKIALKAAMASSDARASKCEKLGISFVETYPQDHADYVAANERYNKVEQELAPLYEQLAKEEAEEQAHRPMEE